jgi:hypothetical protein
MLATFCCCEKSFHNTTILYTLQAIFDLCVPKKDLAKPHSQISTKYHNIITIFCWSTLLDAAIQVSAHREQYISIRIYEIQELMEEINISGLEQQRWSLEFFVSFFKIYVCEVWLIPFGIMYSKSCLEGWIFGIYIYPQLWKVKTLFRSIYSLKLNSYFRGTVM